MSCGAWCEYTEDDINGKVIIYCVNCGRRGYSDEFDDYESDPDVEREMMQEAGLL